jgi:hypothetical protein
MQMRRIKVRGLLLVVAWAAVALAAATSSALEEGDPWFGAVAIAASVVCLAALVASGEFARRGAVAGMGGVIPRWCVLLRSLTVAAGLIGVPDVALVAAYWCSCEGRWYVVPYLHGPRVLNRDGVVLGAAVALLVAFLLRLGLLARGVRPWWRLASLATAASILALLLAGAWLIPRRNDLLSRAMDHAVLEGQYGGAEVFARSPDFPLDARKAAYHRRMKRRYEEAARYPWLRIEPDPW